MHDGFEPVEVGVAAFGRETVEVHCEDEVGVEVQDCREVAFHGGLGIHKRLVFTVRELYVVVLEVNEGGGIRTVVDRSD